MGGADRELGGDLDIGEHDIVICPRVQSSKLKRPMDVVLSANEALRRNSSLLYLFIGDGMERAALEAKCAALGI